jgi:hypothetical protein
VFERDEKGNVIKIVVVVQNINSQKKGEEEIAKQHNILKQAEELARNRKLGIQYQNKRISMERWYVCLI